jgi:hypothetical protein
MSAVGGFLDGLRIDLSPRLNCIIGGRGAGKTTVVEFLRYVLDAAPDDPETARRTRAVVERNLSFGRVEAGIETKDGASYVVVRTAGEPPVLYRDGGRTTPTVLQVGGLLRADVYGQNEVEGTADRAASQLELVDGFAAEEIAELDRRLKHVDVELASGAGVIGPLQDRIAALREEIEALPGVEERLKRMSADVGDPLPRGGEGAARPSDRPPPTADSPFTTRHSRPAVPTADFCSAVSRELVLPRASHPLG